MLSGSDRGYMQKAKWAASAIHPMNAHLRHNLAITHVSAFTSIQPRQLDREHRLHYYSNQNALNSHPPLQRTSPRKPEPEQLGPAVYSGIFRQTCQLVCLRYSNLEHLTLAPAEYCTLLRRVSSGPIPPRQVFEAYRDHLIRYFLRRSNSLSWPPPSRRQPEL